MKLLRLLGLFCNLPGCCNYYWGIDKAVPGFNDNKGVSLVLVNNKTGLDRFEQAKDKIEWKETRIEDSIQ